MIFLMHLFFILPVCVNNSGQQLVILARDIIFIVLKVTEVVTCMYLRIAIHASFVMVIKMTELCSYFHMSCNLHSHFLWFMIIMQ